MSSTCSGREGKGITGEGKNLDKVTEMGKQDGRTAGPGWGGGEKGRWFQVRK